MQPYLCRLTSSSGTWLKRTTTPRTSPSGCAPTSGWVESSSRRYYTPAAASSPTTADNQMPAVENAFRDFWSPFLDSDQRRDGEDDKQLGQEGGCWDRRPVVKCQAASAQLKRPWLVSESYTCAYLDYLTCYLKEGCFLLQNGEIRNCGGRKNGSSWHDLL